MTGIQPMRLLRIAQPFDDPDFVYEWKIDGFRGLASVENGQCRLVSRNGHTFTRWDALKREIATSIRCRSAVLDGEIACLDLMAGATSRRCCSPGACVLLRLRRARDRR